MLGYHAQIPQAGLVQSYFLLDSRRGHIGQDRGAIQSMANLSTWGEDGTVDFMAMTNSGDIYSYITSREAGRVAMSATGSQGALGRDFDALAAGDWLETTFKPTGQVRGIGQSLSNRPYRSVEYAGIDPDSGTALKIWLADPDFDVDFYAATYMGVGIIPLPKAGVQKLITRMEGQGATFELSYVMRKRQSFSGAPYQDMSAVMKAYTRGAAGALQP